jgi:hypothetical protein
VTSDDSSPTALPIVLRNMPLTDVATLHGVVVRMMDVASSGTHERWHANVVDRINGDARSRWTRQDSVLTAHHDVRCFVGIDDLDALHLTLVEGHRTSTIVEPRRIDRTNVVGRSEDPTAAVLSTLSALRSSLAAASADPDDWTRPRLQNDHMHEASLAEAFVRSIPDHVDATVSLSGQDVAMFVNIVMPSPYARARYDGAEVFARDPKAVRRAAAKASPLLPTCVMASRKDVEEPHRREWEISPYRTGFEMVEAKGGPMERLRVLARIVEGDGPKG